MQKVSHADVAQEYGVSQNVVGQIMHKMRKNPQATGEILAKSHAQLSSDLSLSSLIKEMLDQGVAITSASIVKDLVASEHNQKIGVN